MLSLHQCCIFWFCKTAGKAAEEQAADSGGGTVPTWLALGTVTRQPGHWAKIFEDRWVFIARQKRFFSDVLHERVWKRRKGMFDERIFSLSRSLVEHVWLLQWPIVKGKCQWTLGFLRSIDVFTLLATWPFNWVYFFVLAFDFPIRNILAIGMIP